LQFAKRESPGGNGRKPKNAIRPESLTIINTPKVLSQQISRKSPPEWRGLQKRRADFSDEAILKGKNELPSE
jgi:hypothetical protein